MVSCIILMLSFLHQAFAEVDIALNMSVYDYDFQYFNDTESQKAVIFNKYCHQACKTAFTKGTADRNEDCAECFCDDACMIYNDCCPDKYVIDGIPAVEKRTECKSTLYPEFPESYEILNDCPPPFSCQGITFDEVPTVYEFVTTCPEEFTDKILRSQCEQPVENDLSTFQPLTNPATGAAYRNKYCAECNKVYTGNIWSIQFICRGELPKIFGNTYMEVHDNFLNASGCYRYFTPPAMSRPRICSEKQTNLISRCNETGLWQVFDNRLNSDCLGSEYYLRVKSFKNIFCYLCNTDVTWFNLQHDQPAPAPPESSRQYVRDITMMITNTETYAKTKIWNPIKNQCIEPKCPDGKVLNNVSCEAISNVLNTYKFSVCIDMHDIWGKESMDSHLTSEGRLYLERFYTGHVLRFARELRDQVQSYTFAAYYLSTCVDHLEIKAQVSIVYVVEHPGDMDKLNDNLIQKLNEFTTSRTVNGANFTTRALRSCTKTDFEEQGMEPFCDRLSGNGPPRSLSRSPYVNIVTNAITLPVSKLFTCIQIHLAKSVGILSDDKATLTLSSVNKTLSSLEFDILDDAFVVCLDDYLDTTKNISIGKCLEKESTGPASGVIAPETRTIIGHLVALVCAYLSKD